MTGAPLDGPRPARPDDRDAILDTLNLIFRTAAGRPPTIAVDHGPVYRPANLENVMIVRCGERVVASTGVLPVELQLGDVRLRVGDISTVGVLPEYRRLGLGRIVMEAVWRHMRSIGCHVGLLVTDIDTWYRSLGWERAGGKRTYRIDRGNVSLLPALPPGVELRPAGYERGGDLLRLRNADRLGAVRDPDLLPMILASRRSPALYFAEKSGQALAYLLVREQTVIEWGGPAEIVAGLVGAYLDRADQPGVSSTLRGGDFKAVRLQSVPVVTPSRGHPFIDLLDHLRIPYALDYCGMLRIVDPAAMLAAYGVTGVTVAQQGEGYMVSEGAASALLSPNELTKLFLGPERVCALAPHVFPLPFWQWPLDTM